MPGKRSLRWVTMMIDRGGKGNGRKSIRLLIIDLPCIGIISG
jgi:hypothetical protein